MSVSTKEELGGGVGDLNDIQEDAQFMQLASMSPDDIDSLLAKAAEGGDPVELSVPDNGEPATDIAGTDPNATQTAAPQVEQNTPPAKQPAEPQQQAQPQAPDAELEKQLQKLLNKDSGKQQTQQQPAEPQQTVPQQALHAARQKTQEVKQENKTLEEQLADERARNAYLMGKLEGTQEAVQLGTQPQQPAFDPQAESDAIKQDYQTAVSERDAAIDALDQQFDDGEIGQRELRAREREIQASFGDKAKGLAQRHHELEARVQQQNNPQVDPVNVEQQINSDPWLQQNTNQLRHNNPWLDVISDELMSQVQGEALQLMERRGQPIGSDVQTTWLMRQTMAEVGKHWGLDRLPVSNQAGTAPSVQPANPSTSPTPEDRLEKLTLANNHPPAIGQAGSPAPVDETPQRVSDDSLTAQDIASQLGVAEIERLLEVG